MPTLRLINLAPLVAFFAAICPLHSAIIFAPDGDDLTVTITEEITFTSTANVDQDFYGFILEDVFTSAQGQNLSTSTGTSSLTINGSDSTFTGGLSGNLNASQNAYDPNDLRLAWFFPSGSVELQSGETITISTGARTLPGYLSSGILPDNITSSVSIQAITGLNVAVSNSQTVTASVVPEPTSGLLAGISGLIFGLLRKRHRD